MTRHRIRTCLWLALITLAGVSLLLGSMDMTLKGLLSGNATMLHTLHYSRLPRTLSLLLAAASLALSGLIMQKIVANPFVSPQTTLTMDGAKFGVLAGLLLGFNAPMRLGFALTFAAVLTLLFLQAVKTLKSKDPLTLPVLGIIMGNALNALTTMVAMHFDLNQTLDGFFNKGFTAIFKGNYEVLWINAILIVLAYRYYKQFSMVGLGDEYAQNLGLNVRHLRALGIVLVSSMSCLVMLSVGNVPFVGLLIPNVVALWFDDSAKGMFIDTVLTSCVFVLVCDILARIIIQPYELPIALVSGVLGGILFLIIIVRGRHETV